MWEVRGRGWRLHDSAFCLVLYFQARVQTIHQSIQVSPFSCRPHTERRHKSKTAVRVTPVKDETKQKHWIWQVNSAVTSVRWFQSHTVTFVSAWSTSQDLICSRKEEWHATYLSLMIHVDSQMHLLRACLNNQMNTPREGNYTHFCPPHLLSLFISLTRSHLKL